MNWLVRILLALSIGAAVVLGVAAGWLYGLYTDEQERNLQLESQLVELQRSEQQSVVMQRINAQMEEIANESRSISEEQREVAIHQSQVAESERRHAEEQRQIALQAEHRAVQASEQAERQRVLAEHQRSEAEHAKQVADTLSYLTLARSLGNLSINQFMAGNREVAEQLAYTACLFTDRYKGDIYSPTVYQSLVMTSQSKQVWNKHKGSVTDIAFSDEKKSYIITCSTYGELLRHQYQQTQLKTDILLNNPHFDFRDVFIDRDKDIVYAISRTGHLIIAYGNGKKPMVVGIPMTNLCKTHMMDNRMYIFGDHAVALFDLETRTIKKQWSLSSKMVCISLSYGAPIIFDNQGRQHIVKSIDKIETSRVPVSGQVTAYAESKHTKLKAYGMNDGIIYLIDAQGGMKKLVGHRSRISKMKFDGYRLYSSSYDGVMNLWMTNSSKVEPMSLFTTKSWIINFTFDLKKQNILTGDQNGTLTKTFISVPMMKARLKNLLKRDLTRDEWNYFVGRNIPYEKLLGKETKP